MKKTTKLLALLTALVLLVGVFAACQPTEEPVQSEAPVESAAPAEPEPAATEAPAEPEPVAEDPNLRLDTLIVGTPDMNGDFVTGFGNSSYDLSIKVMTGGFCDTYEGTTAGQIVLNTQVVANVDITTDEAGNKTYAYTLCDDIKWNNGDPMTAKDFVAGVLKDYSPEWIVAGATSGVEGVLGYEAYMAGETKYLKGLNYIDDLHFSMTLDANMLPYFFETVYATASPVHMATWMPGAEIVMTEEGCGFNEGYDLQTALNNIATTERFAPTVTGGPYKFVSYENQIVTLEINEFFKGDLEGQKPTIQYVVQKSIPSDTDVDAVIAGDVDFVGGVIEGAKIEAAKSSTTANTHSYLRNGYGLMAMCCDWGPTKDANVRWALASMIDRAAVIDYVLGGYGGTVDGAYGLAQWMYEERSAELEEAMTPISFNLDTANDYLDLTDYKFEADGATPFDRTKAVADGSYLRHNAAGEPLVLEHFGTDENEVTDIIEIQYSANAPLCGVDFNVNRGDFNALLANYYYGYEMSEDERIYSSYNLATNFNVAYDPYQEWHSDYLGTWYNACQLSDPEVDRLSVELRGLDPSQTEEFADIWVQFQVALQKCMPQIPLYSNEYFDITYYTVKNVTTTPFADYEEIICKLYKDATPKA